MSNVNELEQELARLRAENEALAAAKTAVSIKVSEKGAISVYGLGRFPVTLYVEQMEKFLAMSEQIREFIEKNRSVLSVKQKKA